MIQVKLYMCDLMLINLYKKKEWNIGLSFFLSIISIESKKKAWKDVQNLTESANTQVEKRSVGKSNQKSKS